MELEGDTIEFVRKNFPDITTPNVIHSWTDQQWHRSFLLMSRCSGNTLQQAWPSLSNEVRNIVAQNLVRICGKLACLHSSEFRSPTGYGIFEPMLDFSEGDSARPVGPFSVTDFNAYFLSKSGNSEIQFPKGLEMKTDVFVFYHPDLNPGNILISTDGNITAIIDWEGAGYYPHWYVATKMGSFGFQVELDKDPQIWQRCVISKLRDAGFQFHPEFWQWYEHLP